MATSSTAATTPVYGPESPWRSGGSSTSAVHATKSYRDTDSHHYGVGDPTPSKQGRSRFPNQRSEDDYGHGVELQDLPLGATALVSRGVSADSGRSSPSLCTGATRGDEEEEGVRRSRNGAETDGRAESRLSSRRSLSSSPALALGTDVARRLRRGKALHDFWGAHVSMLVEQDSCRDHLGKCCALSHPPAPGPFSHDCKLPYERIPSVSRPSIRLVHYQDSPRLIRGEQPWRGHI